MLAETYFSPSAEYTTNFEGKSNSQIVDQLYQNIFGRSAEAEGLIDWATKLTNGTITVAELALQLSYSAQGTDATVVDARIEAAIAFTDGLDTAEEITGYYGDAAAAQGRVYLAQISGALPTTDEAITAQKASAVANVDESIALAVEAGNTSGGETFNLTTALDTKTLGSSNDQAYGVDAGGTPTSDTFQIADQVNGGAGTDTFFLTLSSTSDGNDVSYTPNSITNFEKLQLTNVDDAEALTVDVSLMGVTGLTNSGSSQNVTFSNAPAGSSLSVINVASATTAVTVLGTGLTGDADAMSLSLSGSGGAVTITSTSVQDIEALNVKVTGTNTSNVTVQDSGAAAGVTSLTVTGSGSWDAEAGGNLATAVASLDASANSGGVTFTGSLATGTTLTGGSGNDVLTGGSGNDVISGGAGADTLAMGGGGVDNVDGGAGNDTITVTALTEDDSIAGGDGVDTLVISSAIAYDDEATPDPIDDGKNISGFEVLRGTASLTQDMAALDGVVVLQSAGGVLTATEASGIGDFYALANNAGVDLTLATDGASDSLNVHVGADATQSNVTGVTVDAVEIETALIASKGANGNTITDFEADALTTLTVIGDKTLTVTLNDSAAVATIPLTSVDASAFTGASLTVNAVEADSGVTVTTGSQALSVTVGDGANNITGTAGADTITTGSGNDTIVSLGGDDTIEAGDGVNAITATDGENDIDGGEGIDTITVGNGNNTIDGGDGADVIVAGTGNNTITNSAGNATITSGDGDNIVTNTAGNSTITLGDGTNNVTLTAGNSTVVTGDGADTITVTAGNNNITSGGGNDTITLGSGNDTIDAGAGTDSVAFSIDRGTWTGAISDAESITATYTGSATIDAAGITGYTTLNVTAGDTTATTTINNVISSTINLSDDTVEGGGTGDIEAMTIDTVDDATVTVNVGANLNAATDLASLTVTDAASVTLTASGGGFGNLIAHDLETVTLDDAETTSISITTEDYTSITEANLQGTESVASFIIDVEGTESDVTLEGGIADAVALTTLSITADGLNATLDAQADGTEATLVGDAEGSNYAILDTISISASNGADIDASTTRDAAEGDINTQGDVVSMTLSADGAGSVLEAPTVFADGDNIGSVSYSALNGATLDSHDEEDADTIVNWGFDSLALTTSGAATLEAELVMDEGAITASPEATITIEAGAGSTMDLDNTDLGAVDLDTYSLHIGSLATVSFNTTQSDVEVDDDIGAMVFDFDANSTFEGNLDIEAAGVATSLSITMGAGSVFAAEADLISIDVDGGSDSEVGIQTLTLTLDTEADTTVNTTSTDLVIINGLEHVEVGDSEGEGASDVKFYQGSVDLTGSDNENTVNISNVLDAQELDTAGAEGTWGSWTVDTGEGNDTVVGSAGVDTITTNDGLDSITGGAGNDVINSGGGADTVAGGAGNDNISVGNGADTVAGGAGADAIDLTESVSSADSVNIASDVEATTSDSGVVAAASGFIDSAEDTVTTFTAGTDTILITSVGVASFVHGTDTDLGLGNASAEGDAAANYATNVGLVNLDGTSGADEFGDDGDILVGFSSPTTTMTEALFEAALQYNIQGTTSGDTITGGDLADTISGLAGNDVLSGGAGADTITGGAGADTITLGTGSDTVVYADTAANNGVDSVADFEAGLEGDILDFTNFITVTEANIDLGIATNAATTLADDHIFDTALEANIASADFEGDEFGDIFAESGKALNVEASGAMDFVVIVRGDDVTQVLYVSMSGLGDVTASEVTAVGTLTSDDLDADNGFTKSDNFGDT
ncbi:MAG: DUF4214 domain-containing protein [Proteobacteria bacterium]|nr:DUF4214 domain-containing protein [Pseudomonadota bacterium]